jgi:hypothetical protein
MAPLDRIRVFWDRQGFSEVKRGLGGGAPLGIVLHMNGALLQRELENALNARWCS